MSPSETVPGFNDSRNACGGKRNPDATSFTLRLAVRDLSRGQSHAMSQKDGNKMIALEPGRSMAQY